jgi:uncharacterized delta-60 repeat protein
VGSGLRKALVRATASALLALAALPAAALAAPGDLDTSYGGGDGVAQLDFTDSPLLGAVVQPDGKLVAVGRQGGSLIVVRFGTDGQLDPGFADAGVFTGGPDTRARGVALQADGRIVVGGTSGAGMLALRLNANGTPDASFSGDGVATAAPGPGAEGRAVALQGGKVVVAGNARLPAGSGDAFPRVAVARFNSDGSIDGSFGDGGARVYGFGRLTFANAVAIDGDSRIVLAGSQRNNLQTTNVLAARLNPNGDLDPTFSGTPGAVGFVGIPGLFVKDYARSAGYAAAFDVAIDSANRPVLAGAATNGSSDPQGADAIAVRLTTAGVPDPSFSGDGIAYLAATASKDQFNKQEPFPGAAGLVLGGNDVILAGYFDDQTQKRLALWALDGGGALDPAFGDGGRATDSVGQHHAIAIAANGDLFGVGDTADLVSPASGLAAKYAGVGPPPPPPGPTGGPPPPPPPPGPSEPQCLGETVTVLGTSDSETLRGTPGRDVIAGFGGADRIVAKGTADLVCGGRGNDRVYLQGGNDRAAGGPGQDLLAGAAGADTLFGNGGRDRLFGALGADNLFGGNASDVVLGGKGPDLLRGGRGDDTVNGGAGKDNDRQ